MADHGTSQGKKALFSEFPPVPTEAWEARIQEALRGTGDVDQLAWTLPDGIRLRPFYRRDDLHGRAHLGVAPGAYPFARGTKPVSEGTPLVLSIVARDPSEANRLARLGLERDAGGIHLHADLRGGLLHGLPLRRPDDLAHLFEGLPLDRLAVHHTGASSGLPFLAAWLDVAERHGITPNRLRGTIGFNPLSPFEAFGWFHERSAPAQTAGLVKDLRSLAPGVRLLACDASLFHEAGATSTQTLACALGLVSDLLARLTDAGVPAEDVLASLHVVFPLGVSFFPAVARLRAFRLLFARVVEAYTGQREARPYVVAHLSRAHRTAYDPYVNMLRTTTEAAAALIGGCDALCLLPHDTAAGHPDAFSHRMALNTGLILQHESHLDAVVDPAGGAYYLEVLSDRMAEVAWERFQALEARGGLLEALRQGHVQQEIAASRAAWAERIASGRSVFVGINRYPDLQEHHDPDALREARIPFTPRGAFPSEEGLLDVLRAQVRKGTSFDAMIPPSPEAVAPDTGSLMPIRGAASFERMRLRTECHTARTGRYPRVALYLFGDVAARNARATFSRNFFGAAGFEITETTAYEDPADALDALIAGHPDLIVLCSADAAYQEHGPDLVARLRAAGCDVPVIVAGDPGEHRDTLQKAGIADFIHRRTPLLETLERFQRLLGVTDEASAHIA